MKMNTALHVAFDRETAPPVARLDSAAKPVGASTTDPNGATFLLHVRFQPDSSIFSIDECPVGITNLEWFKRLCARAGDKFATRAGGRGFFRLTRLELEALKAQ